MNSQPSFTNTTISAASFFPLCSEPQGSSPFAPRNLGPEMARFLQRESDTAFWQPPPPPAAMPRAETCFDHDIRRRYAETPAIPARPLPTAFPDCLTSAIAAIPRLRLHLAAVAAAAAAAATAAGSRAPSTHSHGPSAWAGAHNPLFPPPWDYGRGGTHGPEAPGWSEAWQAPAVTAANAAARTGTDASAGGSPGDVGRHAGPGPTFQVPTHWQALQVPTHWQAL
jgi:hypothetical protein